MRFLLYILMLCLAAPALAVDVTEPVEAALLATEPEPFDVIPPSPPPASAEKPAEAGPAPVLGAEPPGSKASAMRDMKIAADAKDFPGMIRALDKLLHYVKLGNQDRLLQKAEFALLKITDPTILELLRSQVTDDRMKQRLASRQLASAQVVQVTTVPVARHGRFQVDPYYATSPFSLRDNRSGGNVKFGSPSQYGVEGGGAFSLSPAFELGWHAGYRQLTVLAPAGFTMPTTQLGLYGGGLDIGWYPVSDRSLRFSLGTSFDYIPFILTPDATTLQMIGAFMPAATFALNYEMALSEGFSLGWRVSTAYLLNALTSQVRNASGYEVGGDLTVNIEVAGDFFITLSGRGNYQKISTSATDMTRYWIGGGLGILVRYK